MLHLTFYLKIISSLNAITLTLWIGSLFYYILSVQSSVSLLDKTLKSSVLLQNLKKFYQVNGITAVITILCQGILFTSHYLNQSLNWLSYLFLFTIILMIFIHFYGFSNLYQKASRAIRPKSELYKKINNNFKLNLFLGIINIILLNFL